MVRTISLLGCLLFILFQVANADSSATVTVQPGVNQVSVKVLNKSDVHLKSVYVEVKEKDLPRGLMVQKSDRQLDVNSNSLSSEGFQLAIRVKKDIAPGAYSIPFMLKDRSGHGWQFTIAAKVEKPVPRKYKLLQNYPNPFNGTTQITYSLSCSQEQRSRLKILDVLGKEVRVLVDKQQAGGQYNVTWDGKDDHGHQVPSGVYFYRLTSGSFQEIRKMLLLE